jgi:hypothetical protein
LAELITGTARRMLIFVFCASASLLSFLYVCLFIVFYQFVCTIFLRLEIKFMSELKCEYVVQYHKSYLTKKDTGAYTLWVWMAPFRRSIFVRLVGQFLTL